jgi:four helix bundle protein
VPANIAEAWKKRQYPKMFVSKIVDAAAEAGNRSLAGNLKDTGYLPLEKYNYLVAGYDEINRMLLAEEKKEKFSM